MKKIKKFLKSFTLIELIIVIAIIAILGGVAFLLLSQYLAKSRDSRKVTDINALSKALVIYDIQYGGFPLPSRAIALTDEYGQEIGKQGLFDDEVYSKLSSLAKVVKDPFTKDYYGYTRYDNNKGFEIGTFFELLKPYSIRSYIYAQEVETKPYVYVYGDLGFCDENGELTNPKPISVYDTDRPEYVSQKNMGMNGKIMYNLKYLFGTQETGTGNCASEISAPIVAITSVNDTQNIKNTVQKPLIDPVSGVQEGIQEVCTHISPTGQSLCNTPDIYRISYTKNILIYELGNGEIYVVEMEYDPGTDKFVISEEKSIYNGGGTNSDKGTVYGVYPTGAGGYEIYYGGGNGGVVVYSEGASGGTGSVLVGGTTILGGGASTATSGGGTAAGGAVITYGESATNKGYITYVESTGGTPVVKTSELPFDCKMPKIINVNQDEYIVMYIGTDGKIHYNTVKLSSSGEIVTSQEIIVTGQEILAQEIYEIQKVWPGVYMIFYKTNTGEYRINVVNENGTGFECNGVGELVDTTMDSYEIVYLGGGRVQVLYKKGTSTYLKEYNISEEGVLTAITEANGVYECADMQMLDVDPTKTTLICKTGTTVSMSSVKDNTPIVTLNTEGFANVGDTRQSTCTKPSNAIYNSLTQITQTYDGENWLPTNVGVYSETGSTSECKFKCEDGYNYEGGVCKTVSVSTVSGNCTGLPVNATYYNNSITYSISDAPNGTSLIALYNSIPNSNTCEYKCDLNYSYNGSGACILNGVATNVVYRNLSLGGGFTCYIQHDGKISCWGGNDKGQLGNNTTINSKVPVMVEGINNAKSLGAGSTHSCALLDDKTVKCWGRNYKGVLGDGTIIDSKIPVSVLGINSAISLDSGVYHACVVLDNGTVKCWGRNYYGQLGNNTTTDSLTPVLVQGIDNAIKVSLGDYHSCALLNDRTVKCWGSNTFKALGSDVSGSSKIPVLVSGITDVIDIGANGDNVCVTLSSGEVKCWGRNYFGQLGNNVAISSEGTIYVSSLPVFAQGIDNAVYAVGSSHSCALLDNGQVKCWGDNYWGAVGNNSITSISIPVLVYGSDLFNVIDVSSSHSCGILTSGGLKCWGNNSNGQLGNNTTTNSKIPVSVYGY